MESDFTRDQSGAPGYQKGEPILIGQSVTNAEGISYLNVSTQGF